MPENAPLKVVELGSGPAAAYAARLLADLGASVTKLSVPGLPPPPGDLPEAALALDTGKEVVTLAGEEALERLLASADVLICAANAADLEQEPLALARRRAAHPALITVAVTPFGESGPNRDHQGSDLITQHGGGLGYGTPPRVSDPEQEYPLYIPGDPVEPLSGLVAVLGLFAALAERDQDGRGRHVEVSAQEAVASLMFNNIAGYVDSGVPPGRLDADRPDARRPTLPCADGELILMANRAKHVRLWLEMIGERAAPLLARLNAGESPGRLRREIDDLSARWTRTRARHAITDAAQARHIPAEPLLRPDELTADPQLQARGWWREPAPPAAQDSARRDGRAEIMVPGHPFGPIADGDRPRRLPARIAPLADAGPSTPAPRLPLAGVRVLDFGWVLAGPIAGRILAALGADVIKIEAPAADDGLRGRPFTFRAVHADKRSVVLDLHQPKDRAALDALLPSADVVLENFSTGVMERLGLGWERLRADFPRLTMVSISGKGRTGPHAHHVMFGQLAQGFAGITAIVGYPGGPPRGIEDGGFWSDPVTGYAAAVATLAALRERAVSGRGRRVDVSLTEATAATLFRPLLAAQSGDIWGPNGNAHPFMAPHDTYRCAGDDRWLALAVRDGAQWRALCLILGQPELADDPRYASLPARQERRADLRALIEGWTRARTPEAATEALQAADIAAAPVRTMADLVHDPHLRARGYWIEDGLDSSRVVAARLPWRLHPQGGARYGLPPRASGADTDDVLAAAGVSR